VTAPAPETPGRRPPLRAVVGALGGAAALLAVQEALLPSWTPHVGPAVLAAATVAITGSLVRRGRRLDPGTAVTWRGFAAIAALLAFGQLIRAFTGVGVNPMAAGASDAVLAATGPVTVLVCVRLVRSTGGRVRARVLLDAAVALLALGLLVEMLVRITHERAAGPVDPLIAVGYPAISAVLCAVGLVTLAAVSAPRRRAASWLVICFGSLAVAMAAGSLAAARPAPWLDVLTSTGYLAVLATAMLALAADPGPRARSAEPTTAVPLTGVVVSYCVSFGVVLLALGAWALGRPLVAREAAAMTALLLLTLLRTLVWAAEGARMTRQLLRAEAYFRTLVDRAADITLVLDPQGRITWASAAGTRPGAWAGRDLEGRPLADFVHEEDRTELRRALDPALSGDDERAPAFRLRTRDGAWRMVETVRAVSAAGLPRTSAGVLATAGSDGTVLHLRDVVGRRSTELELERMAYTDYLTGLPNRARLMAAMADARSRAAAGEEACLLLLDLDGFKPVNDIAGHDAGDRLLVQVGARLRATVRDRDLISRLGGDEFAVLVRAGLEEATALAERIVADLRGMRPTASARGAAGELVFDISGSVGVTRLDPGDDTAVTIRQADLALRTAKAAGKNRVCRHDDAADSATGRRTILARDLPAAIEEGRLWVAYQPVLGAVERRFVGMEALVRWDHPTLGPVPPDEFIPVAEDDGLIVPLQRFVLRTALTELAGLLAEGRDLQLGVNISVRHVQAGCLVPDVAAVLAATGVPPGRLVLEITESVLLDGEDRLHSDLAQLREMGCVLALDDFGKGYSSLGYLARLPVAILKMDRGFVAGIETDARAAALVASIVGLGRTLGMDVVAEGAETRGELTALAGMGCRFLQGFLLGRPVPPAQLRAVLDGFDPGLFEREPSDLDLGVHIVGQPG
jgi:diguanylate cyclase (GGDEF)-like protein/PAS domain S-box-containing protein